MTHKVRFDPAAESDLAGIHDHLLQRTGSPALAESYVRRIVADCLKLRHFPERGSRRDDVRAGLRTVGFERRATIAFVVEATDVIVLRILYGGRDIEGGERQG